MQPSELVHILRQLRPEQCELAEDYLIQIADVANTGHQFKPSQTAHGIPFSLVESIQLLADLATIILFYFELKKKGELASADAAGTPKLQQPKNRTRLLAEVKKYDQEHPGRTEHEDQT